MNIGVLASGKLGYSVLLKSLNYLEPNLIVTDSNSIQIIDLAKKNKIPIYIGNPRKSKLVEFIRTNNLNLDLVFSLNYLYILDKEFLDSVKNAVNFHGSLLPKYRGRTPHVWAIINGEIKTGITVHLIDETCDTGDILIQKEILIPFNYTGADILNEFEKEYPELLRQVFDDFKKGTIKTIKQDHSLATEFGKRTPNDGIINWEWSSEKIYNWVRAQAYPYPGAFSYIDKTKIIIDKIALCDFENKSNMPNGTILESDSKILVKTIDGVIELLEIRENRSYCIKNKLFEYEISQDLLDTNTNEDKANSI